MVVVHQFGPQLSQRSGSLCPGERRVKDVRPPHFTNVLRHIVKMPQAQSETDDMLPSKKSGKGGRF